MKKIKCERCGAQMEFDGDDAFVCPECGIFAILDPGGNIYFNDEDMDYANIGFTVHCPNCSTIMVMTEDGCECPECGKFLAEGEYNDELDD